MKPPRVIHRKGNKGRDRYFYIAYYLPGNKNAVKEPVGERIDVPPGTGDWWKKSKHRDKIKAALIAATRKKAQYEETGVYEVEKKKPRLTLEKLAELYDAEMKIAKASQSKNTLEKRKFAIKKVLEFDRYATPHSMNREWVGRFKEYLEKNVSPQTTRTYISSLRYLFDFAVEEKLIPRNTFDKIKTHVPEKEVRHISREEQVKVFDCLYKVNPKMFWQVMMMRLSGYRVNEICNMLKSGVHGGYVTTSVKMNRIDKYPRTKCIDIILSKDVGRDGFVFWNRDRSTPGHAINDACRFVGVPIWGSHQLKKDYLQEMEPFASPYLKNLMAHHLPKGMSATADKHYTGTNLELMKETADKAQKFWVKYLQGK